MHFCLEVADCLAKFQEIEEVENCLLNDPFAEAVFHDLDPEDKQEFADVGSALKKKRIRKAQQALGAARFNRNVRGRGRGRGRGGGRGRQGEPAPAEPSESQEPAAHPHGPPVLEHTVRWSPELCVHCGKVAGEWKYYPNPGGRDGASWAMRCVDPEGKMGTHTPFKRTIRDNVMDNAEVIQWIHRTTNCCARSSSG